MYKTYFKQAVQLLKQNPFISIISILGTALAIMMIMVIIVSNSIHNISVKPEANRGRSYYSYSHLTEDTASGYGFAGALYYDVIRDYFYKMQVPEAVTAFEFNHMEGYRQSMVQREGGKEAQKVNMRFVDNAFWWVYSFDFVQGTPFTQEEFESGVRKAVISQAMARRLFKGENAVGQNIQVDNVPYNVAGVVKDVSQVFKMAYGDVFAPYTSKQEYDRRSFKYLVVTLAKKTNDYRRIAEEIREVERKHSANHAPQILRLGAPYEHSQFDAAEAQYAYGMSYYARQLLKRREQAQTVLLFLVLLLIPAMNLSGFSVSRMKKRREEIGIRKAFGAKTGTVLLQVLYENIITSFIGGILGLTLSYAAVLLMKSWILGVDAGAAIPLGVLVSPTIFMAVVLFCVLLGVLSSGIPALRAARMSIVKSISKNER